MAEHPGLGGSPGWPFGIAVRALATKILRDLNHQNEAAESTWQNFLEDLDAVRDSLTLIVRNEHQPIRMRIGYGCELYKIGKVEDAREEFEKGRQEAMTVSRDLQSNVTTAKLAAMCCLYAYENDLRQALNHTHDILRRFNEGTEVCNLFRPRPFHTNTGKERSKLFPWKKKSDPASFVNPKEHILREICNFNVALAIFFLQTGVVKDFASWPQVTGAPVGYPLEATLGVGPVYRNRKAFFGNDSEEQHLNMKFTLHDGYLICSAVEIGTKINIFNLQNLDHIAQLKTRLHDYEVLPKDSRIFIVDRCNVSAKEAGRIEVWDLQSMSQSFSTTVALPLKGIPYWLPIQVTKIGRLPVHLAAIESDDKLKILHSDGEVTTWVATENDMRITHKAQMQPPFTNRQPIRPSEVYVDKNNVYLSRDGLKIFSLKTGELLSATAKSDEYAFPVASATFVARFFKKRTSGPDQSAVRNYLYSLEVRHLPDLSVSFLAEFSPTPPTVDKTFDCAIEDYLMALVTDRLLSVWELTTGVRICQRETRTLTATGAGVSCLAWDTINYLLVGFKNGTVQKLKILD